MKSKQMRAVAFAIAAAVLPLGAAQAATVLFDDSATNYTGEYRSVEGLNVVFSSAGGAHSIAFDLFGAKSVDGNNSYRDVFTIALNGTDVFSGSFDMSGGGGNIVTLNTLGWAWNTVTNPGGYFQGGYTSVEGLVNLLAGQNTFSVSFTQPGPSNGAGQGVGDESWALNDLTIAPVPLPAGLPLLAAGLVGLGLVASRKRKA